FSRAAENEADAIAVRLLARAGIDPMGLVTFFEKLLADRQRRPSVVEQWFSTHPLTEDRIANTRALVQQIPESQRRNMIRNTEQFEEFQARLRQYRRRQADGRRNRRRWPSRVADGRSSPAAQGPPGSATGAERGAGRRRCEPHRREPAEPRDTGDARRRLSTPPHSDDTFRAGSTVTEEID